MRPTQTTLLTLALAATLAACGDDEEEGFEYTDDGKLTVMTRNLYLGAELNDIIAATTPQDLVAATTAAWGQVNANDFASRADALADEIAAAAPDLVGIQEASLWRTQTPGDAAAGGTVAATAVAFDYLGTLLARLSDRGLPYTAVRTVDLFDVEVPVVVQGGTMDVRLTDRLVVLALSGVPVTNARGAAYADANLLTLSLLGGPVRVKRGWAAVDVTVGSQPITFVTTHLEAFASAPRIAQATELAGILEPITGRVALVGDLNSLPGTEGEAVLAVAGFSDAWETVNAADEGLTCCFPPDLTQTAPGLSQRIDYVLWRGDLTPESAEVVGEETADRTASGLWPSDHAGVVVTLAP
jgi:endonuclease/exonuclease/phosphatase family metal-dependent hydrolase